MQIHPTQCHLNFGVSFQHFCISYSHAVIPTAHVPNEQGEDYVVVSGNVCDGVTEQENLEMHRESAILMARLALELVEAGSSFISWGQRTGQKFGFRAGLHFGKLSAGILGRSRRFYRIFGDTVVTSARMCQHTDPGTVQISDSVMYLHECPHAGSSLASFPYLPPSLNVPSPPSLPHARTHVHKHTCIGC